MDPNELFLSPSFSHNINVHINMRRAQSPKEIMKKEKKWKKRNTSIFDCGKDL